MNITPLQNPAAYIRGMWLRYLQAEEAESAAIVAQAAAQEQRKAAESAAAESARSMEEVKLTRADLAKRESAMAEREAAAAAKDSDLRLAHSSAQSVTAELQSQRQVSHSALNILMLSVLCFSESCCP